MEFLFGLIIVAVVLAVNVAKQKAQAAQKAEAARKAPAAQTPQDAQLRKAVQMRMEMPAGARKTAEPRPAATSRPQVAQRMEHRLEEPMSTIDTAHEEAHRHPAQGNAVAVETWQSQGSLGVGYAGEGCDTPMSVRPISAQPTTARSLGRGAAPYTREEFIKGVIFSEAIMKRGGRRAGSR